MLTRARNRQKRTELQAQAPIPLELQREFTPGEAASLCVIAEEIRRQGHCKIQKDKLGRKAGTSATAVRMAIKKACDLDLVEVRGDSLVATSNWLNAARDA